MEGYFVQTEGFAVITQNADERLADSSRADDMNNLTGHSRTSLGCHAFSA